jgi:peptidyl-prolyl cis-trans isomerase SurA
MFVRISVSTSKEESVGSYKNIVKDRMNNLKSFLVEAGVPESNILLIDASYRFDREKDTKMKYSVNFEFLSSTNKALENYINTGSPLALKIHSGKFEKGDMPAIDKIDWKEGEYTFSDSERVYFVKIKKVLEPRAKMLNEVKGEVISNYQEYLENEWLHKLKNKYPVIYNEEEIQKLIKK